MAETPALQKFVSIMLILLLLAIVGFSVYQSFTGATTIKTPVFLILLAIGGYGILSLLLNRPANVGELFPLIIAIGAVVMIFIFIPSLTKDLFSIQPAITEIQSFVGSIFGV